MLKIKTAQELSHEGLVLLASRIQAILYLDSDEKGEYWNADKEWDSDTLEEIKNAVEASGLAPDGIERRLLPEDEEPEMDDSIDQYFEAEEAERDALEPRDG